MSAEPQIHIRSGLSTIVGGCNGCSRHVTSSGENLHEVTEVFLKKLAFRLCDECRKLLAQLLSQ